MKLVIIARMPARLSTILSWVLSWVLLSFLLAASIPVAEETDDKARRYTRSIEFDFDGWTLEAVWIKLGQASINSPNYLTSEEQKQVIAEYRRLTENNLQIESQIDLIYTNPDIKYPETEAASLQRELDGSAKRLQELAPLAEAILQGQVSAALAELGLAAGGQPLPPVLYHVSPLPMMLIISPRDRIQSDASLSVQPGLGVDKLSALEQRVEADLDVSSLVVPVGGIGSYPTMVMRTSAFEWTIDTISHEWIHNYLTLRPLGMNYDSSPELRTMNETTASLAGKEIGQFVLQQYHPELAPKAYHPLGADTFPIFKPDPRRIVIPVFDFRAEMHATRLRVDELLAEGRISEAETYMEARRRIFWLHGYAIRKLNQAYFAFYGAYADVPGGEAGEDPVGPAVVALRNKSDSLADFLNRIAWMTSFSELQDAVEEP